MIDRVIRCDSPNCTNFASILRINDSKDYIPTDWYRSVGTDYENPYDVRYYDICSIDCALEIKREIKQAVLEQKESQ